MTIEQDFLVSAYFDDQADPDEKRRAEAAIASDPAAAEALRSLTVVRDLVASLSRPRAPDVSFEVLNRLVADAGRPRPWKTWGPYVGRGLGAAAVAASVGLVVFLGGQSRSRVVSDPFPVVRPSTPQIASATAVPPPAPVPATTVAATPTARPVAAEAAEPTPVAVVAERPAPNRDEPPGFRELWETTGPRRDFVVSPEAGESTTATVATLLGQSTHRDFYKIVVPPRRGGDAHDDAAAAVAFTATLDPNEFATLRRRLEAKFGDRLVMSDADPEVAALLADVGQVTAASATPAADVSFPQIKHALRVRSGAHSSPPPEPSGSPVEPTTSRPDDLPSSPAADDPTGPSVVLIWIVGSAPE